MPPTAAQAVTATMNQNINLPKLMSEGVSAAYSSSIADVLGASTFVEAE